MVDREQRLKQIADEIHRLMLSHAISVGRLLTEAKEICDDLDRIGNADYTKIMAEAHLTLAEARRLETLSAKGEANLTESEREWLIALGRKTIQRSMQ